MKTPRDEVRTRPTQAKLRQALFNSLQVHIPGARVLDLFAGPGTLGFEALSRGAESAVFVESARSVARLISENARELAVLAQVEIYSEPVEKALAKLAAEAHAKGAPSFDIVLADPPYAAGLELELLASEAWPKLLKPGGFICLEWGPIKSHFTELPERAGTGGILVKVREKNYGDSRLTTYRLEQTPSEAL